MAKTTVQLRPITERFGITPGAEGWGFMTIITLHKLYRSLLHSVGSGMIPASKPYDCSSP